MDLLREQRAACLRMAGEKERAREEFEAILDRYKKLPALTEMTGMVHVRRAAEEWPDFLPHIAAIDAALADS